MRSGQMPHFLVEQDFCDDGLLPITGKYLRGGQADLVAARRRDSPHGPVANRLWQFIRGPAAEIVPD